jgi:hypothetical protein
LVTHVVALFARQVLIVCACYHYPTGDVMQRARKALAAAPLPGFCCPLFLLTEGGQALSLHWLSEGDWDDPRSVAQVGGVDMLRGAVTIVFLEVC